jgi:hydrophobic/amphiphilic exporter-1 (mainly G- bacteria), HAE1 family
MKKITQFSVNYPVTVLMMVMAVLLLGYISFNRLGIDLFPNLNNPKLYIELVAGERPPEEIENLYVQTIEAQAIRQSDVVQVSSVTQVGSARITVEYGWNKDMDEAYLDLQKALNTFAQNTDIDELNITQFDPNAAPVMIVAMKNDSIKNLDEVRKVAENYVRNEIIRIEGIADVTLAGDEKSEVVIETSSYLLQSFNLTASDVSSKISSYNRNVSGGNIEEQGTRYSIKGLGMIKSPDDLRQIIVGYYSETTETGESNRVPVYLNDVAEIKIQNKDPESIVRLNGERCIGLSVYKEPSYNTVKAVANLKQALVSLDKALPGYKFTVVKDQGTFVSSAIGEVKNSAIIGIILAIVVIFVFLRRINSTIVISIAIPISIVATFTLMYFRGINLNIMSLGGLALGAGMLVDNAIIVVENIYRKLGEGKSVREAAIEGTAEMGGPITASTITTIVVFLPIVYLQGASGELFREQAWTVAFSLLSSLVVAILVIPVLVTKLFPKEKIGKTEKIIEFNWYANLLTKILKVRWTIIIASVALVLGAWFMIPSIGSEFMPRSSSDNFSVEVKLPEGTRLERTSATVEQIEKLLDDVLNEQIASVYSEIGVSAGQGGQSGSLEGNSAIMHIRLSETGAKESEQIRQEINDLLTANPDIEFGFVEDETSLQSTIGDNEPPLVVEVVGEELDVISGLTEQVKELIAEEKGLYNVSSSIENGAPEIEVKVDRLRAGLYNLGIETIITQLKNRLEGTNAGEFEEKGEMRDITVKLPKVSLAELENLEIKSGTQTYRLSDVATLSQESLPRQIHRRNQSRIGKVSAYVDDKIPFDHMVKELEEKLGSIPLPSNYKIQMAGEELKRKESMGSLTFALILSVILVYMVMAAQFESLWHPFIILLSIPLAMVGAIFTFFILGQPFNIMAYIGMIMLAGIAVNDSIILIDAINRLRAGGMSKIDAIVQAGKLRIRPIIMTSLTTILALIPLTIGFGEGASLRSPMAWAVIGGLITSTLLTLVVIPCVYDVFTRNKSMAMPIAIEQD